MRTILRDSDWLDRGVWQWQRRSCRWLKRNGAWHGHWHGTLQGPETARPSERIGRGGWGEVWDDDARTALVVQNMVWRRSMRGSKSRSRVLDKVGGWHDECTL